MSLGGIACAALKPAGRVYELRGGHLFGLLIFLPLLRPAMELVHIAPGDEGSKMGRGEGKGMWYEGRRVEDGGRIAKGDVKGKRREVEERERVFGSSPQGIGETSKVLTAPPTYQTLFNFLGSPYWRMSSDCEKKGNSTDGVNMRIGSTDPAHEMTHAENVNAEHEEVSHEVAGDQDAMEKVLQKSQRKVSHMMLTGDEGPLAGLDQGLKSKDAEPSKKPKSSDLFKGTTKSQPKSTGKSAQVEETVFEAGDTQGL
ncbi:hypothetical protein Tco_0449030 [Tanacetum coccineum]